VTATEATTATAMITFDPLPPPSFLSLSLPVLHLHSPPPSHPQKRPRGRGRRRVDVMARGAAEPMAKRDPRLPVCMYCILPTIKGTTQQVGVSFGHVVPRARSYEGSTGSHWSHGVAWYLRDLRVRVLPSTFSKLTQDAPRSDLADPFNDPSQSHAAKLNLTEPHTPHTPTLVSRMCIRVLHMSHRIPQIVEAIKKSLTV